MRKIVVFGNAGGGKSVLANKLSALLHIPVFSIDKLQWKAGGVPVSEDDYRAVHDEIMVADHWILDGFGTMDTFRRRLEAADTIIFVDHPLWRHYWWDLKRTFLSLFDDPVGWPEGSPVVRKFLSRAKFMWFVHGRWTPQAREIIRNYADRKNIVHIRSAKDINIFLSEIQAGGRCR